MKVEKNQEMKVETCDIEIMTCDFENPISDVQIKIDGDMIKQHEDSKRLNNEGLLASFEKHTKEISSKLTIKRDMIKEDLVKMNKV